MGAYKTLQRWNGMQMCFAVIILIFLFVGLFAFAADTTSYAATTLPTKMNFQGRVTNSVGNILPNGTYNMRFKIFNAATNGTQQWAEDRLVSAGQGVVVTNGQFSVQLGSVTSLPASIFASNSLYFEVELPTPASATTSSPVWTELPMTPRNQLATSAYAYNSETLDGLDSAAFGQLDQNNTFTGNNTFNGTLQGGSSITLGTAAAQGLLVLNDGNGQTGTLRLADTAGNYTYTIPVTTASDTFCLATLANCGGISAIGSLDGTTASANGAAIVGSTLFLQSASITNAGLVTTATQSISGNKTFTGTVSVGGATTLNDTVTIAAEKTIKFVGGTTGTRPVSPGDGAVFFDTTTKQLLAFANGKWQADRSDAVLVAASNSTQADKDAADYVADGNTAAALDGDQVQIQSAITAGSGKKVVLLAGTYVVDATVLIPNNTTFTGVGDGTLLEMADTDVTDNMIENSDTSTGTNVSIQNLRIDGRSDLNTAGAQSGIRFVGMGGGSGSTARPGGLISNVNVSRMRSDGIDLNNSHQNTISSNYARANGSRGYSLGSSSFNTLSNNVAQGNTAGGYLINGTNSNSILTGNIAQGNTSTGFAFSQTTKTTITGNTSSGNSYGFFLSTSTASNVISGNTVNSNTNGGINVGSGSDGTSITGNSVTGTSSGDGINVGSDNVSIGSNTVDTSSSSGIVAIGDSNTIIGNVVSNSSLYGISVNSSDNTTLTGNRVINTGNTTSNNAIHIFTSDGTNISGNIVSDTSATSTNYAINIANNSSDATYMTGNSLGGGSINNLGVGTVYVNQADASGSLITRNQGGMSLGKTTAGTTLDIQGAIQNVALPTPTAPTLSTSGTAGTTTYGYRVAALDGLGETLASTETTISTGNATLTGVNLINITWPQVGGAVQYKVFRSTSGGTPATTGLIRTVSGNVLTTTDTGIAASGAVAVINTTGNAAFAGAMQGGSSLSLGTASVAGSLAISDGSSNTATIKVGSLAGNYEYTIPVTTASDTFCMQTLANCGAGGGVSTVGALDGGTANATGATIVGSTFYLQSASASYAGLVNTGTQTFAGDKTFSGTLTVSNSSSFTGALSVGSGGNSATISTGGLVLAGTARSSRQVTLTPEYAGSTFRGDGTNNNGNLSSDFCSASALMNVNTTVCAATGEEHSYYEWTTTQATAQDYDIYVKYKMPSDFDTGSLSDLSFSARGTTSAEAATLTMYQNGTQCLTSGDVVTASNWQAYSSATPSLGSCTIAAGTQIVFKISLSATQNQTVYTGDISFSYKGKF